MRANFKMNSLFTCTQTHSVVCSRRAANAEQTQLELIPAADAPASALLHCEPDGVCVYDCMCVCYVFATTVCVLDKVLLAVLGSDL